MSWTAPNGNVILMPHERTEIYTPSRAGGAGIANYWKMDDTTTYANECVINGNGQVEQVERDTTSQGTLVDGNCRVSASASVGMYTEDHTATTDTLFRSDATKPWTAEIFFSVSSLGTAYVESTADGDYHWLVASRNLCQHIWLTGVTGTPALGDLKIRCQVYNAAGQTDFISTPTGLIAADTATHIMVTQDASKNIVIWADAESVATKTFSVQANGRGDALPKYYLFGLAGLVAGGEINGKIDNHAYWWDTVLDDTDIISSVSGQGHVLARGIRRGVGRGIG